MDIEEVKGQSLVLDDDSVIVSIGGEARRG